MYSIYKRRRHIIVFKCPDINKPVINLVYFKINYYLSKNVKQNYTILSSYNQHHCLLNEKERE